MYELMIAAKFLQGEHAMHRPECTGTWRSTQAINPAYIIMTHFEEPINDEWEFPNSSAKIGKEFGDDDLVAGEACAMREERRHSQRNEVRN